MADQSLARRGAVRRTHQSPPTARLRALPPKRYSLGLTLGRHGALVALGGEVDVAAAPDIAQLMRSLEGFVGPIHLDLTRVTFLDSSGLQPLIEATRQRQHRGLPSVRIDQTSRVVQRLLDTVGLDTDHAFNVAAWDELKEAPGGPDGAEADSGAGSIAPSDR